MLITEGLFSAGQMPYDIACCTTDDNTTYFVNTNAVSNNVTLFKLQDKSLINLGSYGLGSRFGSPLLAPQGICCSKADDGTIYFGLTANNDFSGWLVLFRLDANSETLERADFESFIPGFGQGVSCCKVPGDPTIYFTVGEITRPVNLFKLANSNLTNAGSYLSSNMLSVQGVCCCTSRLNDTTYVAAADAGSNQVHLFTINPSGGPTNSLVGPISTNVGKTPQGISCCSLPDGQLYFAVTNTSGNSVTLLKLDILTNSLVSLGNFPVENLPQGISCCTSPEDNRTYFIVANAGSDTISLLRLNPASEALELAGTFPTGEGPIGVSCCRGYITVANSGSDNISLFQFGTPVPPPPPTIESINPAGPNTTINTTGVIDWTVTIDKKEVRITNFPNQT